MKRFFLSLGMAALALNCHAAPQGSKDADTQTAAAKAAIKELASSLQAELKGAMQGGGSVAAIGVCNTRAMPLTAKAAANHGMALSRVSLKNRNPANMPNDWQTDVLEYFEQQKSAGKDVKTLTWSETVSTGVGREFRFMKAIPTGEVCLRCHGAKLAPEVNAILSQLYPEDRATGFNQGDIRGAFVAVQRLPD